jgi:hypothetical protein
MAKKATAAPVTTFSGSILFLSNHCDLNMALPSFGSLRTAVAQPMWEGGDHDDRPPVVAGVIRCGREGKAVLQAPATGEPTVFLVMLTMVTAMWLQLTFPFCRQANREICFVKAKDRFGFNRNLSLS